MYEDDDILCKNTDTIKKTKKLC